MHLKLIDRDTITCAMTHPFTHVFPSIDINDDVSEIQTDVSDILGYREDGQLPHVGPYSLHMAGNAMTI